MRCRLGPSASRAASTYIETFILIGIAVGGSGIVFGAMGKFSASTQGPGVALSGATIRQGQYLAVLSLTLFNTGQSSITSVTLTTSGVLGPSSYCYSLLNPVTREVISGTCPTMASYSGSLPLTVTIPAGGGVLAELTLVGTPFTVGTSYLVSVITSAGAAESQSVQAVPA